MNTVADQLHQATLPSFRGIFLALGPWLLSINEKSSFLALHWWEIVQYLLSIAVALFGLYDFYLKIRWKKRQEREDRESKKKGVEAPKDADGYNEFV